MEVDVATPVSLRGAKRAAEPVLLLWSKRARPSPPPSDDESSSEAGEAVSTPSTPASLRPSRQKRLACTWPGCNKVYSRPIHLTEHLNSHKGIRTHACKQCDKKFFRGSHLKHHVKNAHSDVREYVCDWEGCGKAFGTGTRLRRHLATHAKRQEYPCDRPGCSQSFRKHAALQKHIKTEHEGRSAFVCDKPAAGNNVETPTDGTICGAGFQTQGKLLAHHGRVHGVGRYWCTICSDTNGPLAFSTYTEFKAHNADVHPPKCSECLFTAVSSKDLRQHLKLQHAISDPKIAADAAAPGPATNKCDRTGCNKTFSRRSNLLTHIKSVHEGQRFVCGEIPLTDLNNVDAWDGSDACGKDFAAKGGLESHIRAAHLKEPNPQRRKLREPKKRRGRVSAAAKIAGTGYAEAARPLACFVTGCAFRFTRPYDRAVHARTTHGLGDTDIAALAAASAAASVSTAAAQAINKHDDIDPDMASESASDKDEHEECGSEYAASEPSVSDYEEQLEQGAADGGVFWLGGSSSGNGSIVQAHGCGRGRGNEREHEDRSENEWDAWEAEEMYAVVHGGDDQDDEYDFTLEDDIPPDNDDDGMEGDFYGEDYEVTGTGGRVDMMLLG